MAQQGQQDPWELRESVDSLGLLVRQAPLELAASMVTQDRLASQEHRVPWEPPVKQGRPGRVVLRGLMASPECQVRTVYRVRMA